MMTAISSQTSGHDLKLKPTVSASVATVGDFFQLMKPRVMTLVTFTGLAGMYLAPGEKHLGLALVSLFAIAAGAGDKRPCVWSESKAPPGVLTK